MLPFPSIYQVSVTHHTPTFTLPLLFIHLTNLKAKAAIISLIHSISFPILFSRLKGYNHFLLFSFLFLCYFIHVSLPHFPLPPHPNFLSPDPPTLALVTVPPARGPGPQRTGRSPCLSLQGGGHPPDTKLRLLHHPAPSPLSPSTLSPCPPAAALPSGPSPLPRPTR